MRLQSFLFVSLCLLSPALAQWDEIPDPDPTETPEPTETPSPPLPTPTGIDTFANVTVYTPEDPSAQVTFARTEDLPNNTVLAAWNDPTQTTSTISVYRSINSGFSWYSFGTATSFTTGRKLLQPHLLYVNGTFAGETGITLLAVSAVDNQSTHIEVYASYDSGESWEFVKSIASGGAVEDAATAVADPFLLYQANKITLYYTKGPNIVQQTASSELDNWGTAIDVVSSAAGERLGLATVAKLPSNQYIIAVLATATNGTSLAVSYKLTTTPENAAAIPTQPVKVDTGVRPQGAPFVTWSPLGGSNGTIVLSDSNSNSVFINQALGQGNWEEIVTKAGRALGREIRVPANDQTKLRFAGGAEEGPASGTEILVTVIDFEKALA